MQVGEVGIVLTVYANSSAPAPTVPVSLTGATATLVLVSPVGTRTTLPLVVSVDGLSATRTTQSTDFITAGVYQTQLVATYGGGNKFESPVGALAIGPAL